MKLVKRPGLRHGLWPLFKKLGAVIAAPLVTVMLTGERPAAEQTDQFDIIIRDANSRAEQPAAVSAIVGRSK